MKAAVCYEFGKPLVIEDIEIRPPAPGEVKIKNVATAVCHSDIHLVRGTLPFPPPMVGGHETAGYVEEIGEGVTGLEIGDPVCVSLLISCGECRMCSTGHPNLCEYPWERGAVSPYKNQKGEPVDQAFLTGTFAEYTVVHKSQLVKLPPDMPLDRASLLACGVATGFGAVVWRAKVELGASVAVVGVGGVGVNSIQGASLVSAYPIIAVDINDQKLEAAKQFGATHTVNSAKVDPIEAVRELTGGRGADYVFVTVGSPQALEQSVPMAAALGSAVWVGIPNIKDTVTFSPFPVFREERSIIGCWMGHTNLKNDIPKLITLYKEGKLKLDELITKHYKLEDINEAMETVERGEALRNIIMF
ncbi:MAG: Zn-dependent alcohol dehydrogenase [Thermoleophilia bacterium]|nr:Zn-dependent alcohol dehydrogenase [Thermoleophilia bacterium]